MAKKIRYFTARTDKNGERYYWQPSAQLKQMGWKLESLPSDPVLAEQKAIQLNAEIDAWRLNYPDTNLSQTPRRAPMRKGTMDALISDYKTSSRYKRLSENTKKDYQIRFNAILAVFGGEMVRIISRSMVKTYYKKLCESSIWTANATMRVFKLLMNYAIREEIIRESPVSLLEMEPTPKRQQVWSKEAEDFFIDVCVAEKRPSAVIAFLISAYVAQRQGDILLLTKNHYKDDLITLRQNKTASFVSIPVYGRLKDLLDNLPKTHFYLVTSETTGQPYKSDNFKKVFARLRKKASEKAKEQGLDFDFSNLKFLDLRRTSSVRLAEAGCTAFELSAVTGHKIESSQKILETYVPRNSAMASAAIKKLKTNVG